MATGIFLQMNFNAGPQTSNFIETSGVPFFEKFEKVVMMRILYEININLRECRIGIHNGMIFHMLQESDTNLFESKKTFQRKLYIFVFLQLAETNITFLVVTTC